jgi:uncharacterized protein (DUF362 family)
VAAARPIDLAIVDGIESMTHTGPWTPGAKPISPGVLVAGTNCVNVDAVGNRTAAMTFGPKKVIIVAGMNKVRPDLQSALERIREVAGPLRAKSLNLDTPCAKTGVCIDCNAPKRICEVTTILHRKPWMTDISVILVNESLGY